MAEQNNIFYIEAANKKHATNDLKLLWCGFSINTWNGIDTVKLSI